MQNKKHKNNIVIASLLAIVLVMGIGYVTFSSKLSINETGSVSSNWDIKITNMESVPSGGSGGFRDIDYETLTKIGGTGYGTTDSSIKYNTVSKELEKGTYTLTFTYRKDGSGNSGTDTAYVKNIKVNDRDLNKLNIWKVNIDYHYDCNTYTCSYQYNNENAKVVKENSSIMVNEEGLMTATVSSGNDKGISKKYVDTTPPTLNIIEPL